MKYPKNRADVYVVMRDSSVLGIFSDYDEAEDYRGACEQEFRDKVDWETTTPYTTEFKVKLSTFYG